MSSVSDLAVYHTRLKTTFQGILHPYSTGSAAVAQYRGIKFASIPGRWRQSRLFEEYPDHYDATRHGPSCPQPMAVPGVEDTLNGITTDKLNEIIIHEPFHFDEFECLNLNISIPKDAHEGDKMPVMVCVHGGGHMAGSNASWFNDGGALVARSIELGKPVVFVSTNHRLGSLGWLASKELLDDNHKAGDKGVGNYGPHDTHLAIEWVYRNITAFGGDPDNITILGESAGSMNVMGQIHLLLPGRFRRAILQSGIMGAATINIPSSLEDHEISYEQHKHLLKAGNIEALRCAPVTCYEGLPRLLQPFGAVTLRPTLDDVHYNSSWREQNSSVNLRNFELLIGDTAHEYTVWEFVISKIRKLRGLNKVTPVSTKNFIAQLFTLAPRDKVALALSVYGIHPDISPKDLLLPLWSVMEDANFAHPTEFYAAATAAKGGTVYRYLFDEHNPFGGPSYRTRANHALDLSFIYGAPGIFADVEHPTWETRVRESIQEKWISFAFGEKIWTPLNEGGYFAFGPEGQVGEIGNEEFAKRRRVARWGWIEGMTKKELWDVVLAVAEHVLTIA